MALFNSDNADIVNSPRTELSKAYFLFLCPANWLTSGVIDARSYMLNRREEDMIKARQRRFRILVLNSCLYIHFIVFVVMLLLQHEKMGVEMIESDHKDVLVTVRPLECLRFLLKGSVNHQHATHDPDWSSYIPFVWRDNKELDVYGVFVIKPTVE